MRLLLVCLLLLTPEARQPLKDWADGPINIILSDVEKKAFGQLKTDGERQQFIDNFWASRNANPSSRSNEFKQEFERRVEKANALFAGDSSLDGWQSERGRYYVLLGEPKSRAQFKGYGQLRPIELWFYSGKKEYPQLPAFFYLMFFERDEVGDYRRYSPFIDQPQSLVKATIRDNGDAYRILSTVNSELARASLSLIPGEPVDTANFAPTMYSDAILAQINQIPKRAFERAGMLKELVNVKLKYGGTTTMTLYPFVLSPEAFAVDLAIDRPEGLDDAAVETVVWRSGKEEGRTSGRFGKTEPVVGRLVLKPGDYVIESRLSNPDGTQAFTARESLHLPPAAGRFSLSDVLFFRSAAPAAPGVMHPFTHAGYQFAPDVRKQFHPADKLQVLFQIAAPDATSDPRKKIAIDYTIAGIHNAATRWTFHDEVAVERLDASGLLLNSKTMSIRELTPGRYLLVIMATDPAGHRASQTVSFEVTDISDNRP
jgi:GWxTD domain-containing protein